MNLGSLEIFLEINTGGRRVMWDFCLASQVTGLSTSFPVPMKRKNTISNVFLSRKIWWKEATKCVLKKQLFLKMSHNSQENTCSGHSDTGVFLWELKTKTWCHGWSSFFILPRSINWLSENLGDVVGKIHRLQERHTQWSLFTSLSSHYGFSTVKQVDLFCILFFVFWYLHIW